MPLSMNVLLVFILSIKIIALHFENSERSLISEGVNLWTIEVIE